MPPTLNIVTPCVGVWIEIDWIYEIKLDGIVTPCVGVWIEIGVRPVSSYLLNCHSLRGSVD